VLAKTGNTCEGKCSIVLERDVNITISDGREIE
jgi:hypothetical protein